METIQKGSLVVYDHQTFVKKDQSLFTPRKDPLSRLQRNLSVLFYLIKYLVCVWMGIHFSYLYYLLSLTATNQRLLLGLHSHVKTIICLLSFCLALLWSLIELLYKIFRWPSSWSFRSNFSVKRPFGMIVVIIGFRFISERIQKFRVHLVVFPEQILAIFQIFEGFPCGLILFIAFPQDLVLNIFSPPILRCSMADDILNLYAILFCKHAFTHLAHLSFIQYLTIFIYIIFDFNT